MNKIKNNQKNNIIIKFVIDTGALNHQIIFIKALLTSVFILFSPIVSCEL
jgi:hypothetical protein